MDSLDPEVLLRGEEEAVYKLIQDAIDTSCLRLYIRYFQYITELTVHIGFAKSVRSLSINHNVMLQQVPAVISDLVSNLTYLDLSHNGLISLPDSIIQLVNLISLNLSYNHLTTLPFGISEGLVNLNDLNVSHNWIQYFPYDILQLDERGIFSFRGKNNRLLNPADAVYLEIPPNVTQCAVCSKPLPFDESVKGPMSMGKNTFSPYGMTYISFELFFGIPRCPFVFYVCELECYKQCYRRKVELQLLGPPLSTKDPITIDNIRHFREQLNSSPIHDKHCRCTCYVDLAEKAKEHTVEDEEDE